MSDTANEDQTLQLDAWHREQGARMVSFAGYQMPIQYEGIMAEHKWTRDSAGLFDVSHMGQVMISGEGAAEALEAILPGEMQKLGVERMRYSLLLAPDGGILDDLMITRVAYADAEMSGIEESATADYFYMVVNGACKYDDLAYLRENLPDNVTINHLEDRALIALQGPKAGEAMMKLIPETDDLYFMQAGGFTWNSSDGDVAVWISRSGYTGEDGFEISVAGDKVDSFARALTALEEVKPIGLGARDSLRLEAGLPLYGHDLDPTITPITADLGFAMQKRRREEGGFAGAERILGERANGSAQKRVGLFVSGRQPVREGAVVVDGDGAAIGKVTSGGFSPTLERPIAMAYVPTEMSAFDTEISVEQRGKIVMCTVTNMPFTPHGYRRKPKA